MKLRFSPASPYVRKVSVTALELGLGDRIERVVTDTKDPKSGLGEENPLGKVPTLVTDQGEALCESPVICEYLDHLGGSKLYPPAGPPRWRALNLAALADGILDSALTRLTEIRLRQTDKLSAVLLDRHRDKIARALDRLEEMAGKGLLDGPVTIGEITLGCALGYLDFRFDDDKWREGRPTLAKWFQGFEARPSMQATMPENQT